MFSPDAITEFTNTINTGKGCLNDDCLIDKEYQGYYPALEKCKSTPTCAFIVRVRTSQNAYKYVLRRATDPVVHNSDYYAGLIDVRNIRQHLCKSGSHQ